MKTVIQTRIDRMKDKFESNQQYIQKVADLTTLEYNQRIFELGCEFLKSMFPPHSNFGEYYKMHEYSPFFWKWWMSEWKQYEATMISQYSNSDLELNALRWNTRISKMINNPHIERSFSHNYIEISKKSVIKKNDHV